MISLTDVYHAVAATVPLYVAMILAFISVRFWKLFTPDQCAGINKFVAKFSIPLLSFQVISSTNLYKMNLRLVLADFAQKILTILILGGVAKFRSGGGLRWIITGVSLSTLPNTLILGIPILRAMYGDEAASLVAQIVFLQSILWYNLLLFLFELNATKAASVTPSSEATGVMVTTEEDATKDGGGELKLRNGRKYEILLIFLKVGKNLMRNPNTYATFMGVIWASIHFRWGVELPAIVNSSIQILSQGGLGMAMFSLDSNSRLWCSVGCGGHGRQVYRWARPNGHLLLCCRTQGNLTESGNCAGGSTPRNCSLCFRQRVQRISRNHEHRGGLWNAHCHTNIISLLSLAVSVEFGRV
ncbi:auxin efflux carrier component 8 isoform X2 [Syzygium oleosum]|uniref:auxin efflux carrier component 8 isoform X2 n=1 Tax=Syzygium oleosum TaxID=219896 RepID=UPI0011D1ACB8|nr:auxin efflux carrier component 8 isoform X2 [Syzygium oleosum]